ncbi:protein of unknown function [Kyrpidia spormannii]|uniref:Uncharacterized protein n=1 Tax=Kyrpidia spormannii TaxID=2055160 RepID=A0ACA8ZCM4_9BACL|nr:protein of unknown function [Kyrpidia spormannii]
MQPEPNPDEAQVEPMVNRVPCNGHDLEDWYLKYLKKPPALRMRERAAVKNYESLYMVVRDGQRL